MDTQQQPKPFSRPTRKAVSSLLVFFLVEGLTFWALFQPTVGRRLFGDIGGIFSAIALFMCPVFELEGYSLSNKRFLKYMLIVHMIAAIVAIHVLNQGVTP